MDAEIVAALIASDLSAETAALILDAKVGGAEGQHGDDGGEPGDDPVRQAGQAQPPAGSAGLLRGDDLDVVLHRTLVC